MMRDNLVMDEKKKQLKHWLRTLDEGSVETLCKLAKLQEDEIMIIILTCCRWHDENYIADMMNMSAKNLHKRKMYAVQKLMSWCGKQYQGEDDGKLYSILWENILRAENTIRP